LKIFSTFSVSEPLPSIQSNRRLTDIIALDHDGSGGIDYFELLQGLRVRALTCLKLICHNLLFVTILGSN
jgi:hypothetical protein